MVVSKGEGKETHIIRLPAVPVALRSTTWTTISGTSEEASGDGFASMVDMASAVTDFAILSLSLSSPKDSLAALRK
jgi:hypothetical protein